MKELFSASVFGETDSAKKVLLCMKIHENLGYRNPLSRKVLAKETCSSELTLNVTMHDMDKAGYLLTEKKGVSNVANLTERGSEEAAAIAKSKSYMPTRMKILNYLEENTTPVGDYMLLQKLSEGMRISKQSIGDNLNKHLCPELVDSKMEKTLSDKISPRGNRRVFKFKKYRITEKGISESVRIKKEVSRLEELLDMKVPA